MKRALPLYFRSIVLAVALLFGAGSSFASHIVGGDIYYTHITGLTYRITVVLYGDCGPASAGAFATLDAPTAAPRICIYDGTTLLPGMPISIPFDTVASTAHGVEITPICEDSLILSQCLDPTNPIPGIKKFVYQGNYTLPHTSSDWRFIFNANYGPSSAGRAAAITNLAGVGSMQLTATLNNTIYDNSSPNLTVVPTPFFCLNSPICYTPGAIDAEGDSLRFNLVPATYTGAGACGIGSPATYTGTAWPGTPVSATTPLRCVAGSFNFNPVSGQVCFDPNFLQRSIVVYTVSEYRGGTLVGTMQREMTFLVRTCLTQAPSADTGFASGVAVADGPKDFHVCGDEGAFAITMYPRPDDTSYHIICTATGLPAGITFNVVGNGTNAPVCTFSGDASTMTPGVYTFFLNLKDDACPVYGNNTVAYTLNIYPVPTITHTVASAIDCINKERINIIPGGTGEPWTIKVVDSALTAPTDTIATIVTSTPSLQEYGPGKYYFYIFTSVSTECGLIDSAFVETPPKLLPTADTSYPTFCGKDNGSITLSNLNIGGVDTITYDRDGVAQTPIIGVVSVAGTMTIPNLRGGVYSNIVVHYGYCTSDPIGPYRLIDPPFTLRAVTYEDPTKCGYCDGSIKLYGLHPDQLDTVTYTKDASAVSPTSFYISGDSSITIPGLCAGVYTTFNVKTAGVCQANLLDVLNLVAPPIDAQFDTFINYGCHGDTLMITNRSTPASDLTYAWEFGDGGTSTGINPQHVYTNTVGSSYVIKLFATNTKCLDSFITTFNVDHYLNTDFTQDPTQFICQTDPVNFTNASTGTGADYTWYFSDGNSATTLDAVHQYTNMGTYNTMLVSHNVTKGVHCFDTMSRTIVVDSNSELSLNITGDVTAICRSQSVTLTAVYTTSGQVGNEWTMTDGFAMNNVNPVIHSFDGTGPFTVNFKAQFRACPEKEESIDVAVIDVPSLYLGPDTAMCPGSAPILLKDERNAFVSRAKWKWNTEDKGSELLVTKPGTYAVTVTIDGCSATDTVLVAKDCYVDVPNVFTPNGDGVNDYFFPRTLLTRSVVGFKMSIFNRWGQVIYETSSTDGQGWDGAMNKEPQPSGVYIYLIEAVFKDGMTEQHKGNVTLLR